MNSYQLKKVLIVDDSGAQRKILKKFLELMGFEKFVEAENGEEGFSKRIGIDLFLTDYDMPLMNGLEMVKRLRDSNVIKPIIMLTTASNQSEIGDAKSKGLDGYLIKPYTFEDIKNIIGKVL